MKDFSFNELYVTLQILKQADSKWKENRIYQEIMDKLDKELIERGAKLMKNEFKREYDCKCVKFYE